MSLIIDYEKIKNAAKVRGTSPAYIIKSELFYRNGGGEDTKCSECKNFVEAKFKGYAEAVMLCHVIGIFPTESFRVVKNNTCLNAEKGRENG